ncbi:hypothetical protein Tsubulata_007328 [Turnera subulata]|uniref:F-box domain-containing protein n=1 Tax=Turnera subulata TaxID=218843 RepID=A0A9Q0FMZ1_9ROSI|nr:hypothetical protein Tsubulata_007328 [Turnera subulata]
MSATRSQSSVDGLSSLPDALLIYILSFLTAKDAVKSSVLSKRWNNLWLQISSLLFSHADSGCSLDTFAAFVTQVLIFHEAPKIRRFHLQMEGYQEHLAPAVDEWLRFAITRQAEDLNLEFNASSHQNTQHLSLHEFFYNNQSLRLLSLQGFRLCHTDGAVCWPCLTRLCLTHIEMEDEQMRKILCGSPSLLDLEIVNCQGLLSLNLTGMNVKNVSVGLVWQEEGVSGLKLLIPKVVSLSLSGDLEIEDYFIEDATSLERAEIGFELENCNECVHRGEGQIFKRLRRIVESLNHAKVLSVKSTCVEMFSVCEMLTLFPPPAISHKRKCLILETTQKKHELPGIFQLLRRSPEIEKLTIKTCEALGADLCDDECKPKCRFNRALYLEYMGESFSKLHQNLKTVEFHSFLRQDLDSEFREDDEKLQRLSEKEVEVINFFLKNAQGLEEAVICVNKEKNMGDPKPQELMCNMFENLSTSSRASPDARVLFL